MRSSRTGGFETLHGRGISVHVCGLRTDRQRRWHVGVHRSSGHGQIRLTGSLEHVQKFKVRCSGKSEFLRLQFFFFLNFICRTNLPKEIMELPGFPHKDPEDKSYVAAKDMLKYLEDYADHFDLKKHVKV